MPKYSRRRNAKARMLPKHSFVRKREVASVLMQSEKAKWTEHAQVLMPINDAANFAIDFTDIPWGTDNGERIGNQILVTGVYGHITFGSILPPAANATVAPINGRIIIYTPRNPSVGLPFVYSTTVISNDEYIVWHDQMLPYPYISPHGPHYTTIKLKFKPYLKVEYNDGTDTSAVKNALTIVFASDSIPPSATTVTLGLQMFYRDA